MPDTRRILLGRIVAVHGVRGEVVVKTFTGEPEAIAAYGPLWTTANPADANARKLSLRIVRVTPKGVIVRIKGIDDRNAAEALGKLELWVDRTRLPAPSDDEFYHEDLVGLAATDASGATIGTVVAIQNFGADDLLEVRLEGSSRTELFPFTKACVPSIDLAGGRLIIVPPPAAPTDDDEPRADSVDPDTD